ncbi:E3 ubiquitin-protein ligase TTC3 isoform X3 [Salarias fasciatus]|uniref:E3 ubiquitin-protein ligase TTC3 isoform X3 n=1 Tax=Salarias fasciatus TaxID=181472 RepID=UPI001176F8B4|nr:E3 ubiquitin-protein ligase TTC3 isoform X3 [Salarias fasciatus]
MSDSDSDSEYGMDWFHKTHYKTRRDTIITFRPTDEIFEKFSLIPVETKKLAVQRMRICAFWLPALLQPERHHSTLVWAIDIGMRPRSSDLSLDNLAVIHLVERVLDSLEQASMKRGRIRQIVAISNMFNLRSPKAFHDAMIYLEQLGDLALHEFLQVFQSADTCSTVFHLIFTEFAKFIQDMGSDVERTMRSLMHKPADHHVEKSEEMKKKGNKHFQNEEFGEALKFYTEAIRCYPDNHFLYGNRALCYLRCKQYLKAAGDGVRATLLKPLWAKGHYRYAEALFFVGQPQLAFSANSRGQELCKEDQEARRDLAAQQQKFIDALLDSDALTSVYKAPTPCKNSKGGGAHQTGEAVKKTSAPKVSEVKGDKQPAKNDKTAQKQSSTKEQKPPISESSSKNNKAESNNAAKKKAKNRNPPAENKQKETDGKSEVCKKLRSAVQDAHAALVDLRSRNAEQAFSQALALLETTTPKEVGLSTVDVLLLMFGRASALTDIGQPEELAEAQKVLEKMKSYEDRTFQCLVYYAVGRVFFRENKFAVALEQFSNSMQMVKNQITPGKLTWPLTKEVVKETQPQYFKEHLKSAIESCRFPPPPDAICRLDKCLSSVKPEIFFTDPDFKGFIQMCCCKSCMVEYHMTCWKSLKSSVYNEKNEKDFLHEPCLTPDCIGLICNIKIYGPTGLVKCKFEAAILKPQTPKKPKVNQTCTSLKKLKSKEERKTKRKLHKQSCEEKQSFNEEILPQSQDSASQSQQKAWLLYRDRVLLQISQKLDLLREEKGLDVVALTGSLKPWLELDSSRGNQVAAQILGWQQEQQTVGRAVELLLERKNRVWARVFVHHLSGRSDLNPKLSTWACQLNDAGLNAARSFIERHADHLEQLDLALLLNFAPLQEMVIEKFGTRPELFSSIGLTVTEYLRQAQPQDMRLFIWTLEEHREDYVSCHTLLDEYFDMMDGHCSVLKKSDENNSPMKTKNRGRKKKQREQRGVYVLPEARSVTPRASCGLDFIDEDSLSFLDPVDPFTVPSHLRGQVADFEDQYHSTRHRGHLKMILDNNPDLTKESLYDYFAQILDEHGPLLATDPLLVGELLYFPLEARDKIEQAGGFEAFLLDSLRFIKIGECIGLAKHAVALQHSVQRASLDDLDEITDPDDDSFTGFQTEMDTDFASCLDSYHSSEVRRVLPNPYAPEFKPAGMSNFIPWSNGDDQQAVYYLPSYYEGENLYICDAATEVVDSDPTAEEEYSKVDAAVQTCQETMRSVAVNTEVYERFEKYPGDIMKKEKSNMKLEQDIQKMTEEANKVRLSKPEDIISLEGDIEEMNANIQVTNKELVLFQQKLEEEVKKDQKEKKANQETLKSLKQEIDELLEEQGSLTKSIREKKASYETKLTDFLDLSNQSATEKMSLEDEIKHCKALLAAATQRSLSTQLLMVESSREQCLYSLRRDLVDSKALLAKMDEALTRIPNKDLEITRNGCRTTVEELKKRISNTEQEYQAQVDKVKTGSRVNDLPPVNVQNQPEAAAAPLSAAAQASRSTPPPPPPAAAAAQQPAATASAPPAQKAPARTVDPPSHSTVFDKAMDSLAGMFPDCSRSQLRKFVQQLRSSSGGSLSSMALQDVVSGAAQLILDHQEKLRAARSNAAGQRSPAVTPPLPTPVWQAVPQQSPAYVIALNAEDPCIICHEDMNPADIHVLECRHSFHHQCIKSWLKEQSTCPTCRNHALMNDEFPALIGRRRPAP